MPDTDSAGQKLHDVWAGKVIAHQTHAPLLVKASFWVMRDDPASLLPAVLQGVQAKRYEVGCIGDTDDAKDATFLAQLVIIERVGRRHLIGQGGSSESVNMKLHPS